MHYYYWLLLSKTVIIIVPLELKYLYGNIWLLLNQLYHKMGMYYFIFVSVLHFTDYCVKIGFFVKRAKTLLLVIGCACVLLFTQKKSWFANKNVQYKNDIKIHANRNIRVCPRKFRYFRWWTNEWCVICWVVICLELGIRSQRHASNYLNSSN